MSEQLSPHRQQLLANINAIIEHLKDVPGVTDVYIAESDSEDIFEKKVYVTFANCDEPVCLEIF